MREVVITSACRTPVGAFRGAFASLSALDLGVVVLNEAIARAGLAKDQVDEVIMGCVLPAGLGQNPARQACLRAGLPVEVGCITVNKVCGSGLKAVMLAAQAIACGDAEVIVAGGMESMTNAPYLVPQARGGMRMGNGKLVDSMVHDGLWDHLNDFHMGMSAELCAEKYGVSRQDQDQFAVESYAKSFEADAQGRFKAQIAPVSVAGRKGPTVVEHDEGLKLSSPEALAALRPAFKKDGGTVTAGNASTLNDGAAAVVLMSAEKAAALGARPLVRVGAQAAAGIDPKYVLVAPMLSIPKACAKAGIDPKDIDLHELNEAFASSSLAVQRTLGLDPARINIYGGGISIGHPIGASGARVLTTLIYAMKDQDAATGMASLCLGGGEAVSLLVENI
ncbi:acetyl-CoA acetyltransferase [Desulfarculus baarsii DSM 2075]|uniref:Acetyl-CoA acetyltransferase n=1 Tax=Desulfarculus baarsii (strain ATCC 33931 / DSM 2075 / LMG 7858 / VKM B-1802 / 2st14) TaxID=644282 RepID=E1QGG9_DESB2|nr:acetyl-CoA C-acetyltransferase [Desulfarculus baarsii]ADK84662.1 acetyl-CoA acetyltransferase [Desulfarculus baarsii DSM 2075]